MYIYIYILVALRYITLHYITLHYVTVSCLVSCYVVELCDFQPDLTRPPKRHLHLQTLQSRHGDCVRIPPKSSAVQLRFNAKKNMKMTQQFLGPFLTVIQVASGWASFLNDWKRNTFMVTKSINMAIFWRIYYIPILWFFLQISMNLCPSLPGIDLSLPGLEQLKAVEMEVSESIGKEKNEESSGTPTVSGLKTVDGSEIRQSPVEVGSFFPIIYKGFSTIQGGWPWDFCHQQ